MQEAAAAGTVLGGNETGACSSNGEGKETIPLNGNMQTSVPLIYKRRNVRFRIQ